jgi:8-oxo-dGTP pyrophosphatase MutT (NUDIX family)
MPSATRSSRLSEDGDLSIPGGASALSLVETVEGFEPEGDIEVRDLARVRPLARTADPWGRGEPFHVTASALVVHPPSGRVLLRWHDRLGRWLHVGGHAEPGEDRPFVVAIREAREETALDDLAPWPDPAPPRLVQVVVVPVPATAREGAHEHADLRYALATGAPGQARAETSTTPLRWVSFDDALGLVGEDNLHVALRRVAALLRGR